jgi:starvation-inducible DNA-binding protein
MSAAASGWGGEVHSIAPPDRRKRKFRLDVAGSQGHAQVAETGGTMAQKAKPKTRNSGVVSALEDLLASSYTLYLKTHNFHWNVKGPMFTTLHTLFETEYTELALAVDTIAERIRALGRPAPGTYAAFQEHSAVKERMGVPKATEMVRELARDQVTVAEVAREVLRAAEAVSDDASGDLAVQRIQVHEKNAWMLRSHLD